MFLGTTQHATSGAPGHFGCVVGDVKRDPTFSTAATFRDALLARKCTASTVQSASLGAAAGNGLWTVQQYTSNTKRY